MRVAMRKIGGLAVAAMLLCLAHPIHAQDDTQNAAVDQKLKAQFMLTKVTSDRSDIVTPGSILVLHKDGLLMYATASPMPPMNTYKNGKITQGWGGFGRDLGITMRTGGKGTANDYPKRKFVGGEKFWITSYSVQNDGILLQFYSDPYDDVRYYGQLKIPYPKGTTPPVDDLLKTIAEVVTADSTSPNAAAPTPVSAPAPAPAPAAVPDASFAPVAPPPPPADAAPAPPKTVALGQTKDQVVAILGPPQKVASLGAKEIYYYPDMKVILIKGKVTDVQ